MSLLDNLLLNSGLEAFDDQPAVTVVGVADAATLTANAEKVAELEAARDIATGNSTIATLDSALAADERAISSSTAAINHIEQVQAGLEYFIEMGNASAKTAMMLQHQISNVMNSVGKSGAEITNGGLEAFGDDPDSLMIVLAGSLEALEEEKKSAGARAWASVKATLANIAKFAGEVASQNKRVRGDAERLSAAIKGKPEKEVAISNASLMLGKEYSKNLPADLLKFKDKLIKPAIDGINQRSAWYFKTAPALLAEINGAATADVAVAAARKFNPPALKGASVSVKDDGDMSLKRTEVVLGNYAVFELSSKAASPSDTATAVAALNALAKSRITIQQAKAPAPEAVMVKMNEATAAKVIAAVQSVLGESDSLKGVIDSLSKQVLNLDADGKGDGDKDVRKIAAAASKLPDGLVDTVSQLPRTASRAALAVSEAALAVVSSFAKAGKAPKTDKADKVEKDDKSDDKE